MSAPEEVQEVQEVQEVAPADGSDEADGRSPFIPRERFDRVVADRTEAQEALKEFQGALGGLGPDQLRELAELAPFIAQAKQQYEEGMGGGVPQEETDPDARLAVLEQRQAALDEREQERVLLADIDAEAAKVGGLTDVEKALVLSQIAHAGIEPAKAVEAVHGYREGIRKSTIESLRVANQRSQEAGAETGGGGAPKTPEGEKPLTGDEFEARINAAITAGAGQKEK